VGCTIYVVLGILFCYFILVLVLDCQFKRKCVSGG